MDKEKKKLPLPLAVALIAFVALFFLNGLGSKGVFGGGEEQTGKTVDDRSLKMVLSEIEGVGEVELYFYHGANTGTGRAETDFLSDYFSGTSSKSEELVGLLVVAEGADDIKTKKLLLDILTRVLQLPEHRIVIVPMKKKGEF
ncbi:hypothetical protein ACFOZY_12035 [Chungangia koreensis]|uniref:Stage III sporulation protein AG n=1 Tax=Chungangia koreensis TaxID=752657 RepID=A0ABV8X7T1_9LACT